MVLFYDSNKLPHLVLLIFQILDVHRIDMCKHYLYKGKLASPFLLFFKSA